jgi:hypothetical protein
VQCSYHRCEAKVSVSKNEDFYEVNIISRKNESVLYVTDSKLHKRQYKVIDILEIKDSSSKSVITKINLLRI